MAKITANGDALTISTNITVEQYEKVMNFNQDLLKLLSRLKNGVVWSSVGLDASFGALPGLEIFPAYLEGALKIADFDVDAEDASRKDYDAFLWCALLAATFCELGVVVNYRDGTIMKAFGMIRRRTRLILKIRNA